MAGAIGIAAALHARLLHLTCVHCGLAQRAPREAAPHLVCRRCRRALPAPPHHPGR